MILKQNANYLKRMVQEVLSFMHSVKKRLRLIYQLLFVFASLGLIAVSTLAFQNLGKSASQVEWIEHAHQISFKTERLFLYVTETESAVRGYNLSGLDTYLSYFKPNFDTITVLFAELKTLTSDNISQQMRVRELEKIIFQKKIILEEKIELNKNNTNDDLILSYKKLTGKAKTDTIRSIINEINNEENKLLVIRQQFLEDSYSRSRWLTITILVLFPIIAFFAFWQIRKYLSEKERYENQLIVVNIQLIDTLLKLDTSNQELAAANEELQTSNEELAATTEEFQAAHEFAISANRQLEELNNMLELKIEERLIELKERNESLQRINNDLDDFVYTAAHDLKSPVNTLEGLVEIITFQLDGNATPAVNQTLSLMTNSTTRLKRTIYELTQILRVQKEEGLPKDIIRFQDLFEEVKADIKSLINQIMPEIETDWQVAEILYPQKHMRSILYNLLSNAIKYHHPERKAIINIRSYSIIDETHKKQIFLRIEDNGLGMDAKQIRQLFTMFKRFHDHVEGSGIGLYTIKRIIENNGGNINVISQIGTGTSFTILLYTTDNA